ncbi:hypothetical protein BC628DRAFT_585153 [Trametes gibbosa]|nr:hypothetical protein BC628DRAFT_585153 [Trametes gibbosa]
MVFPVHIDMYTTDAGYHNRATTQPRYSPISSRALTSELFLPTHHQLGPYNWLEFKYAIETILRVKGLPLAHLRHSECPRVHATDEDALAQWAADDELCKAIVVLNVRSDHVRFAELEHEHWTAAEVWDALVQRDLELRTRIKDKWEWLWRVYTGLVGVACAMLYLMVRLLWELYVGPLSRV